MRKLTILLFLSIILAGCQVINEDTSIKTQTQFADFQHASNITIITDTSDIGKGCQYVVINKDSNTAVAFPYYNSDNEVEGCGSLERK